MDNWKRAAWCQILCCPLLLPFSQLHSSSKYLFLQQWKLTTPFNCCVRWYPPDHLESIVRDPHFFPPASTVLPQFRNEASFMTGHFQDKTPHGLFTILLPELPHHLFHTSCRIPSSASLAWGSRALLLFPTDFSHQTYGTDQLDKLLPQMCFPGSWRSSFWNFYNLDAAGPPNSYIWDTPL